MPRLSLLKRSASSLGSFFGGVMLVLLLGSPAHTIQQYSAEEALFKEVADPIVYVAATTAAEGLTQLPSPVEVTAETATNRTPTVADTKTMINNNTDSVVVTGKKMVHTSVVDAAETLDARVPVLTALPAAAPDDTNNDSPVVLIRGGAIPEGVYFYAGNAWAQQ